MHVCLLVLFPFLTLFSLLQQLWLCLLAGMMLNLYPHRLVHYTFICRGGGPPFDDDPWNLTQAQKNVVLPPSLRFTTAPADGNCFYHALLLAARDSNTRSRWTIPLLREWSENPGGADAEPEHSLKLLNHVGLSAWRLPVDLDGPLLVDPQFV